MKDGKFAGRGSQIRDGEDGVKQLREGYWANNEIVGRARVIEADGDWYEGVGDLGSMWHGVYHWHTGYIYTGSIKESQLTGRGKLTTPQGETFEGYHEDGKFSGLGIYTWAGSDKRFYMGQFKDHKKSGLGKLTIDESTYFGSFVADNYHGFGNYTNRTDSETY